jgi:hypothetical protein
MLGLGGERHEMSVVVRSEDIESLERAVRC